jgi:hypothetical protein
LWIMNKKGSRDFLLPFQLSYAKILFSNELAKCFTVFLIKLLIFIF